MGFQCVDSTWSTSNLGTINSKDLVLIDMNFNFLWNPNQYRKALQIIKNKNTVKRLLCLKNQ